MNLKLYFIPSGNNAVDAPSMLLSFQDCHVSEVSWCKIRSVFGSHSVDLMDLDSNVMLDDNGNFFFRHFIQGPSPLPSGVLRDHVGRGSVLSVISLGISSANAEHGRETGLPLLYLHREKSEQETS